MGGTWDNSLKIAYPIIFGICEDQKILLLQKQTEETGIEFQEVFFSRMRRTAVHLCIIERKGSALYMNTTTSLQAKP